MSKLTDLNLAQARDGLVSKAFSAVELTQAHIERVEASDKLNAYVLKTPEKAMQMAAAALSQAKPEAARDLADLVSGLVKE